jgi:predicted nucleic acid-binding protein
VTREILLDAGPLVAVLDARDAHHEWAKDQFSSIRAPLLTNEPVLAEACHLLRRVAGGRAAVLALVRSGAIRIAFRLEPETTPVEALLRKYDSVPMSLADACLVRMAELRATSEILTADEDFRIYRRHGRHVIRTIMPQRR